ncbi:MAG: 4Fe-4S dicluster domain-containing protein, partial [Kiritimatiellaeota bacterium]|nr:4Fe-4S dicluster domain-containing protein [Kiritimatiellota bacterium]
TLKSDGIDAWLLVAPTKGINVWCAAGGGHFSTDTGVSILNTSGIADMVDHRRLILPQLSATGINIWDLKKRTEWEPRFGPVDIKNFADDLRKEATESKKQYRSVEFSLCDRLVMGSNLAFSSLLFLIVPLIIASIWINGVYWKSIPLIFLLSVLSSLLVFRLPGGPGARKGFSLGLLVAASFVIISQTVWILSPWETTGWTGWILLLSTYIGYEQPSWSPLWRSDFKELILGVKNTNIEVVQDRCIGCGLCEIVCPANVFEFHSDTKKSFVINFDACQACGACIENCPNEAIKNNFEAGVCSCPTCGIINTVKSLKTTRQEKEDQEPVASDNCRHSGTCECGGKEHTQRQ